MKICARCHRKKAFGKFHRNKSQKDGLACWCKACCRVYRGSKGGRAAINRYRASAKGKATTKQYRVSEEGKATKRRRNKRYPVKNVARRAVRDAIRAGHLSPAHSQICRLCFLSAEQYHHPNYEDKLSIIPLCQPCHRSVDYERTTKAFRKALA